MEKQNIQLADWERILLGENPWEFMIEVFVRTLIVHFFLILVLRLLGKRMNAQLTIVDLAVMLTLGAIASVPMQGFDKGILPGIILLFTILALHQAQTRLTYHTRKVEVLTHGRTTPLMKDGIIYLEELQKLRISKDQFVSVLRTKGIRHLGEIKRVYSEANGHFSVYKLAKPKPGLSIFPREDEVVDPKQKELDTHQACGYCGSVLERINNSGGPCSTCGNQEWTPAVLW